MASLLIVGKLAPVEPESIHLPPGADHRPRVWQRYRFDPSGSTTRPMRRRRSRPRGLARDRQRQPHVLVAVGDAANDRSSRYGRLFVTDDERSITPGRRPAQQMENTREGRYQQRRDVRRAPEGPRSLVGDAFHEVADLEAGAGLDFCHGRFLVDVGDADDADLSAQPTNDLAGRGVLVFR